MFKYERIDIDLAPIKLREHLYQHINPLWTLFIESERVRSKVILNKLTILIRCVCVDGDTERHTRNLSLYICLLNGELSFFTSKSTIY